MGKYEKLLRNFKPKNAEVCLAIGRGKSKKSRSKLFRSKKTKYFHFCRGTEKYCCPILNQFAWANICVGL
jgi:hypothetical protein